MITAYDFRKAKTLPRIRESQKNRQIDVEPAVREILRDVERNGDRALLRLTKKFDRVVLKAIRVSQKEIDAALRQADPHFVKILRCAAANIRAFHKHQLRADWKIRPSAGVELRQRYLPVDRAGVYVPGGTAAYPSSVLMNVIPAQVAGVKEIHLVSPPDRSGNVHPDVLTAAAILGVEHVYRIGGAQAIGALASGTKTIPAVDVIVGPGNIFVATAKRLVYGKVGIDSFAGPSEVVILADGSANPRFVASDMLAQAEHDERASSVLVTNDETLAIEVLDKIVAVVPLCPRAEIIERALLRASAIYLVKNITQGIDVVNQLAPEHLEIIVKNPEAALKKIRHAGSIFIGNYSPVALGDYWAGPNHVLPTGGTARFSSPLSVDDFMKKSSVIHYSQGAMQQSAADIAFFAEHEGLTAHALSLLLRGKGVL